MSTPMETMLERVEWTVESPQESSELPHVTHSGVLDIAGHRLRVYRISTGQAIIDADDFNAFFNAGLGGSGSEGA